MCNFKTSFQIKRFFFTTYLLSLAQRSGYDGLKMCQQHAIIGLTLFFWIGASSISFAQTIPCQVRLVFDTASSGQQVVSYRLFMQIKNSTPQPVLAVSAYWLDEDEQVIGNSDADCRFDGQPLGLSQTGQCSAEIQHINQRWIERLGQLVWTEMINSELSQFKRIKSCKIVGYRFE